MGPVYDTEKIRAAASQIASLSNAIEETVLSHLTRAAGCAEPWKGLSAEAFVNQLALRQAALTDAATSMRSVSSALSAFANALEAADEHIAEEFR